MCLGDIFYARYIWGIELVLALAGFRDVSLDVSFGFFLFFQKRA
jgi:hypothetical protein